MRRISQFAIRRRWFVLLAALVAVPFFGMLGGGVSGRLTHGGYDDPNSESVQVAEKLARRFDVSSYDFVAVLSARSGNVDSAPVRQVAKRMIDHLAASKGVRGVLGYWNGQLGPLRGKDGRQGLIVARLEGSYEERVDRAQDLSTELTSMAGNVKVGFSGETAVAGEAGRQAEDDLRASELLSAPFTFVALVVVFGAVAAALLPLAVALLTVLATFVALTLVASVTDVSTFALSLTTGLGLGLAVDYSLFIVARYREELRSGHETDDAILRAMQTAGRTVAFSAGTVMVSMTALLLFPVDYLRSFGYAGLLVVPLAASTAIVLLPAMLAALGPRVDAGRVRARPGPLQPLGFWGRQAQRVITRPWTYLVAVTLVLVALALPFRDVAMGRIDDRVLPPTNPARAATDDLRHNFNLGESETIELLINDRRVDAGQVDRLARAIVAVPHVARVDTATSAYTGKAVIPANPLTGQQFKGGPGSWLSVVPSVEPRSPEAERIVRDLRALPTGGLDVQVGGASAQLVDTKATIGDTLPAALALIAVATFVLLFMMTGSLLVPLKALLLNALSLTATFGGMVWVFQQGHLGGLLGFTATGTLDTFTPILMFCIAFGLSMDYEVFLLSRVKEEYDLERNNNNAIVVGLDRTGGVVTAAALLLSIVFIALSTSDVAVIKLFGLGLTLAVLTDAFLIRATLVPALMTLAGRANWWAPRVLRRFHLRFGIWENEPITRRTIQPAQVAADPPARGDGAPPRS